MDGKHLISGEKRPFLNLSGSINVDETLDVRRPIHH